MKIETTYEIGQTVWWANQNDYIFYGKIEYIICYCDSVSYKFLYQNGVYIASERDIFSSQREARKAVITRRIARTKRMLEQDEIRLAELEKEEKTENDAE